MCFKLFSITCTETITITFISNTLACQYFIVVLETATRSYCYPMNKICSSFIKRASFFLNTVLRTILALMPGENDIKLRISVLRIFSPYFFILYYWVSTIHFPFYKKRRKCPYYGNTEFYNINTWIPSRFWLRQRYFEGLDKSFLACGSECMNVPTCTSLEFFNTRPSDFAFYFRSDMSLGALIMT